MNLMFLSTDEVQAIHDATLRILWEVGILLEEEQARSLLADHGARLDRERVYLPPELVESCLASCPQQVRLVGRGQEVILGDGSLHVHNLGGARDVLELASGTLRPAMNADNALSTRLLDALGNVTTVTPLYTPQDVPGGVMALEMFYQAVSNTLKPINGPGVQNRTEVRWLEEMFRVVFGEKPGVSLGVSPISPLTFPKDIVQAIMEIARFGIPFGPLPCPSLGLTAPITLAGALAQQNAENLAAIILAQLVKPGLPVIYCGRLAAVNLRTLTPAWGNPEIGIIATATVQLGHRYGLPVNVYGLACSTYGLDIQNGYERALNAILPALAGADELSGVGEMAGGVCSCLAQIVIDNEIFDMVRRIRRGFSVNEETLGVEVVKQVMDRSRNFMAESHTVKYLRAGEIWQGRLAVQEASWEVWQASGGATVVDRAREKADKILAQHTIPPLTGEQIRALDEILSLATEP